VELWRRSDHVLLESLGSVWAAYCPLSGETHLVNESGVALLQALDPDRLRPKEAVLQELADLAEVSVSEAEPIFRHAWEEYGAAGLITNAPPQVSAD
jgi:PqqD family protein of HPr-rel-A system